MLKVLFSSTKAIVAFTSYTVAVRSVVLIATLSFLILVTLLHFLKQLKNWEKAPQWCHVVQHVCDYTCLFSISHVKEIKKGAANSELILLHAETEKDDNLKPFCRLRRKHFCFRSLFSKIHTRPHTRTHPRIHRFTCCVVNVLLPFFHFLNKVFCATQSEWYWETIA